MRKDKLADGEVVDFALESIGCLKGAIRAAESSGRP
jgi:hypothetical protein